MNPKLLYRLTLPALLAAGMMVGSPRAGGAEVSETLVRITAWEDRREATPELVALLRDGDPAIRGRAALAVGRIGRAADVSALQPLLADKSAEVRRWAAFALGEIEDSTAASPLEALLLGGEEKDAEVRAIAVEGLGKLRRGAPACRAALDDRSSEVVSRALLAAWQIPVPGAIERVLEVSERGEPELRWTSVYCLMRFLGAPASGRTPIPGGLELTDAERDRVEARLRRSLADPDPRVRMNAARGLRADHDTLTTRGLALLARDADWRVRVEALRALAATGPDGRGRTIDPAALQPFLSDLHPNVRVVAVEALATVPDRAAALPLIQTALSDPRPRVRQVAFGSLLTRLRADGIPAAGTNVELLNEGVRAMQNSKDWSLRALTADAIDLMTHDRARQVLETMLKDEPRVAKQAIEPYLLLRARGAGALLARLEPEFSKLVASPDPVMRSIVVGALFTLTADTTAAVTDADWTEIEALATRMMSASRSYDHQNDVRLGLLELAAAQPASPGFLTLLRDGVNDADPIVRREAVRLLRALGETPAREAEPVETGRDATDYRTILEWAERPHWLVIETEGGRVVADLFGQDAPLACWNFAQLAGSGWFDRGVWHRVVPNFVLQDGCPRGDGYGGPDWQIRCEINQHRYVTGALGMALSGKDTGGSQFFFTHSDQPHLDGRYTVFGQIESGQEVADRLLQGSPIFSIQVVSEKP